jgi:hypothetical protein
MKSMMLAALAALSLTASFAVTGCAAQSDDVDAITDGQNDAAQVDAQADKENTGEADQALGFWGGGFWPGIFAGLGCFCVRPPFFGGFGAAGCGIGALGAGFGCGGFGGCF